MSESTSAIYISMATVLLVVGIDLAARGATALLPSPGLIGELPLGALLVVISGAAYVRDRVRSRSHRV